MEEKYCRTCLSKGRNLYPLGSLTHLCEVLIGARTVKNTHLEICWECRASLVNSRRFQMRARIAGDYLNNLNMKISFQSLSNLALSSVKYYDSEISYEDPPESYTGTESKNTKVADYHEDDHNIEAKESDELKFVEKNETFKKKEKAQKNNKWAKVKVLENKQPKFKLLKSSNLSMDVALRRIVMNYHEIKDCMESVRASAMYLSSNNKCDKCVQSFLTINALKRHNIKYHNERNTNFKCDYCESTFTHKRYLISHIKKHSSMFICRACACTSMSKPNAIRHIRERHKHIYKCLKCAMLYQNRREFYEHYRKMHENFICDFCGVTFKLRYCIKDHIRKQHSPFSCKSCHRVFSRKNALWLHTKISHAPARPAYCVECDKTFKNVYSYRWHLGNSVRHNPRRKISVPCSACDKVFTKKIYMTDHYNLVHLKIFKYRCETCDKNFVRNADLRSHARRAHEGEPAPLRAACPVCARAFANNKILTNHLRIHTGERPFSCDICPSRFNQRAAMVTHRKTVHRDKYTGDKTYIHAMRFIFILLCKCF